VTKRGRATYFSSILLHSHPGGDLLASAQGVYIVPGGAEPHAASRPEDPSGVDPAA
jgi:hypothetical protein